MSGWIKPETVVLVLSVVLSLIAISGVVTIGKDAALYMTIAQDIDEHGLFVMFDRFDWPWISLLIAYTHKLTGMGYETAAYFYSVLFMAGLSLFTVLTVKRQEPEAVWWAVLLVLSVPAFNGFRDEIIRETGYWFFAVLAVWAIQPAQELSWKRGVLFQVAVVAAMWFRFEATFLAAAGALYGLLVYRKSGVKNIILMQVKIGWVFLAGWILFLAALPMLDPAKLSRIYSQISMFDPVSLYYSFIQTSDIFAREALLKWSYSDAPKMLLAGIFFILVFRALTYVGIGSVFFISRDFRQNFRQQLPRFGMNTVAAGFYFLVLFLFFVQNKFVNSRYMVLLVLLLLPVLIVSASRFFREHRKWGKVFLAFSICVALSNVISLSDKKTHYIEAAQWVRDSARQDASIFYEDARVQYYAGRGYDAHQIKGVEKLTNAERRKFDLFVVEYGKETPIEYFDSFGFSVVEHFSSKNKAIFILRVQ